MNRLSAGLIIAAMGVAGCSARPQPAATGPQPQAQTAAAECPVIVRIAGRHQTITITAGPGGPRYWAIDEQGRVLVSNATLTELRQTHPELYRQIEPATASASQGPEPMLLDASAD